MTPWLPRIGHFLVQGLVAFGTTGPVLLVAPRPEAVGSARVTAAYVRRGIRDVERFLAGVTTPPSLP